MVLTDTHCHLDILEFRTRFTAILHNARKAGVARMVIPGVTRSAWQRIDAICAKENGIYAAPGLHPMYLAHHRPEYLQELRTMSLANNVVAIGEIGLDYFVTGLDKNVQQELFEKQLDIAIEAQLPILLHVRKAHDQVLATMRRKNFPFGGIVHAFSGSLQQAEQFIKLGFGIGVCGTITYDRAKKIRKNCEQLPKEWLVLETDAPDIIVAQHREEEHNLPEYLPYILETLAQLRHEMPEDTACYTSANAARILHLG